MGQPTGFISLAAVATPTSATLDTPDSLPSVLARPSLTCLAEAIGQRATYAERGHNPQVFGQVYPINVEAQEIWTRFTVGKQPQSRLTPLRNRLDGCEIRPPLMAGDPVALHIAVSPHDLYLVRCIHSKLSGSNPRSIYGSISIDKKGKAQWISLIFWSQILIPTPVW